MISLAGICLIWGLVCLGLYGIGQVLPMEGGRFDYLFIGVFLYFTALIMQVYLSCIDPLFRTRHALRRSWMIVLSCLFLTGYGLTAMGWGGNNFVIAGMTLVLVLFACLLGGWLASHLKRAAEIVAVGVTAGLADLFSVFKGPTRVFSENIAGYYRDGMQGMPPLVDFFLVKIPLPGHKAFMPVFGITDWVLIAFLSGAALKFNMRDNILGRPVAGDRPEFLCLPAACVGLAGAIFFARETGIFLPALPFALLVYFVFMLIKYPQMRQLTKAELLPLGIVSALMIGLMIFV